MPSHRANLVDVFSMGVFQSLLDLLFIGGLLTPFLVEKFLFLVGELEYGRSLQILEPSTRTC